MILDDKIKNSLGYKNTIEALKNVFDDKFEILLEQEGYHKGYDNFDLAIKLSNGYLFDVGVAHTNEEGIYSTGPGGTFDIGIIDEADDAVGTTILSEVLDANIHGTLFKYKIQDENILDFINHEGSLGRKVEWITETLEIFKNWPIETGQYQV